MDIQQLRYIVALSQELNFNKAAKKVGIAQPTLSQQIKKLEEELGEPLFERSPKTVKLSAAGEIFIPKAQLVLETLQNGIHEIKDKQNKLSGTLKMAFIPTVGPYILPQLIKQIKKQAPQLKLELYEETTSLLLENIKKGKFDLGLLALPIQDASLVTKKLGSEEFYLACSNQHPLAKLKSVKLSQISGEDLLILQEGHCFRDQALEFCQNRKEKPEIIFEGSSLISVLNLVEVQQGITLVPRLAIPYSSSKNLIFIPFEKPKPSRDLGVVWRMTTALNKTQKFIIDLLEKNLK